MVTCARMQLHVRMLFSMYNRCFCESVLKMWWSGRLVARTQQHANKERNLELIKECERYRIIVLPPTLQASELLFVPCETWLSPKICRAKASPKLWLK